MIALLYALTLLSAFLVFWGYFGYPLFMLLLSNFGGKPTNKARIQPTVSLFVSCYNEVDVVRNKIENCLKIDYPADLIEFIFVSDGSDDGTDEIVHEYVGLADSTVRLVRQEGRLGKTMGLNKAVPESTGNILVFSDANAMYQRDAVQQLVDNFADETVGYVVGSAEYVDGDIASAAASEDLYWRMELKLKQAESNFHSVVGGDGAIYAIRRSLFTPLDREDINDFVTPLQIVAKGYRGVFDESAVAKEEAAGTFAKEGRRKERIVNRSFSGLMKVKAVLNPANSGSFSFQVISHKLLRWLAPFFMIIGVVCTLLLAFAGQTLFELASIGVVTFLWLAYLGYLRRNASHSWVGFHLPYYFVLVNVATVKGVLRSLRGEVQATWVSPRATDLIDDRDYTSIALAVALLALSAVVLAVILS